MIIEWEYRERLKEKGYKGYFESFLRYYREFFERLMIIEFLRDYREYFEKLRRERKFSEDILILISLKKF